MKELSWYCVDCSDEQEPYFVEKLPKWDDCEEIMEWGSCPAHGDSNNLQARVKMTNKKHWKYVPMSRVIRWEAD